MNLKLYQQETLRTFAFRKSELTTTMTDMLHCAIGVSTEAAELLEAYRKQDLVNISEEIADQMWYVSNLCNFTKINMHDSFVLTKKYLYEEPEYYLDKAIKLSGYLLDMFKKVIFYNKELDLVKLYILLYDITQNLYDICQVKGTTFNLALYNNISKLRIRFPDKFTDELAENRDLESERKELEK